MKPWFLGTAFGGLLNAGVTIQDPKRMAFWLGYGVVSALLYIGVAISEKK